MKKQSLLLATGALLAFASCQNESATTGGYTDAQVDSIVNARVNEQMMLLQTSNDSIINALAQERAEAIVAEMKSGSRTTTPTRTPPKTTPPVPKDNTTEPVKTEPTTKDGRLNVDKKSEGRLNVDDDKSNSKRLKVD